MAWTYNSNRIYTSEYSENTSQIMPRLQPLSGGSILQSFGYDSKIINIVALVVGNTIKDNLIALAQDGGQSHTLVAPEGSLGSWVLKSCQPKRIPNVCQTIDITQAEDAPLYEIELEFWKEGSG